MKRLLDGIGQNSPEEYDRIFKVRQERGVDSQDLRRWKLLLKKFKGGIILDAGCLDSLVPVMALKKPRTVAWGIDTSKTAIQEMQNKYPQVKYMVKNVYDTQFPDGYFDYIVAGELIEHLESPERFFKEAMRILAKDGTLAISTPLEEEKEFGAVDAHRHIWSVSVENITKMLKVYGKIQIRIIGSEFFPKYKYHWKSIIAFVTKK